MSSSRKAIAKQAFAELRNAKAIGDAVAVTIESRKIQDRIWMQKGWWIPGGVLLMRIQNNALVEMVAYANEKTLENMLDAIGMPKDATTRLDDSGPMHQAHRKADSIFPNLRQLRNWAFRINPESLPYYDYGRVKPKRWSIEDASSKETAILTSPIDSKAATAYCVPSAFMAITGTKISKFNEKVLLYRKLYYKKGYYKGQDLVKVTGMTGKELQAVAGNFFRLDIDIGKRVPKGKGLSLRKQLQELDAGRYMLIVSGRSSSGYTHAIAVEKLKNGDSWLADTHNRKPLKWSKDAFRMKGATPRNRVFAIWTFKKWHKPNTGNTPDLTPDKTGKTGKDLSIELRHMPAARGTEKTKRIIRVIVDGAEAEVFRAEFSFWHRGYEVWHATPYSMDLKKKLKTAHIYEFLLKRTRTDKFSFAQRKDKEFFIDWHLNRSKK